METLGIVTRQAPNGERLRVCVACDRLPALRNGVGEEYCSVARGLTQMAIQEGMHPPDHGISRIDPCGLTSRKREELVELLRENSRSSGEIVLTDPRRIREEIEKANRDWQAGHGGEDHCRRTGHTVRAKRWWFFEKHAHVTAILPVDEERLADPCCGH